MTVELKYNQYGNAYATEGYFEWLKSLKPGDEVALVTGSWRGNTKPVTIIENTTKNDRILVSDGTQINRTTGRKMYHKSSYSDNKLHLLPITDDMRYNWEYDDVRQDYRKATDMKMTISEMQKVTAFVNKILTKRKSQIPIEEGDE